MNLASLYLKYNDVQKRDASYFLKNYVDLINWKREGHDTILDVGCGPGDVTMEVLLPILPENFKKLIGCDISCDMVEFAKSKNQDSKVDFKVIDIASKTILNDLNEQFDHIFSFYCFHWIQDQRQLLQNLYELLNPGGDMLIVFLESNPVCSIYEPLSKNTKWTKYMKNVDKYMSPFRDWKNVDKTYEKLLSEVGFNTLCCKVFERNYMYSDISVFEKSVLVVNPFLKHIPEALHNDYMLDVMDVTRKSKCFEYKHNTNGKETTNMFYKLLVIIANKPY